MKLPGAEWTPFTGSVGHAHARPVSKMVLHRTQGSTAAGAFSVYRTFRVEPHFTVDCSPAVNHVWQHVDTARAAWALRQHDADGVIQVEIVGFSEKAAEWGRTEYRNLANMLRPVFENHRIPMTSSVRRPWPATGNEGYGEDSGRRMSADQFHAYVGICGHVHVPDNTHWDPGDFNIEAFINALTGDAGGSVPPDLEVDDMPLLFIVDKVLTQTIYATFENGTVRAMGPAERTYYARNHPKIPTVVTTNRTEAKRLRRASP